MIRVGTSGWTYPPWRGTFYPPGLPRREELAHLSRLMTSVEINASFYALQRPRSYQAWAAVTPPDFVFAVKGGRFITHMRKLRQVEAPLANFLASGVLALGPKLGPLLWQLPPTLGFDTGRLGDFLDLLPRTSSAAAELARHHDAKVSGEAIVTATDADRPLRHALEVRHRSYRNPAFVELLRQHAVALVVADAAGTWPDLEDLTADFVYVRLHGSEQLYTSGYTDDALDRWGAKVRAWSAGASPGGDRCVAPPLPERADGRDVYVYFDNDAEARAPVDAIALARRLGAGPRGT